MNDNSQLICINYETSNIIYPKKLQKVYRLSPFCKWNSNLRWPWEHGMSGGCVWVAFCGSACHSQLLEKKAGPMESHNWES